MEQEDKQLLLKDLCARLAYGVKVHSDGIPHEQILIGFIPDIEYYNIKPYLRTMSSMTDEEENKYNSLNAYEKGTFPHTEEAFDWLLANHFDFRGLIEKSLALEASPGMYKTE